MNDAGQQHENEEEFNGYTQIYFFFAAFFVAVFFVAAFFAAALLAASFFALAPRDEIFLGHAFFSGRLAAFLVAFFSGGVPGIRLALALSFCSANAA
ncbi:MAG TPA: hypothetical protein VGP59_00695 [Pyrinomonadaceae bacterium]|nr:hypothetical protein [Pyrinomonadaceae bacterium]